MPSEPATPSRRAVDHVTGYPAALVVLLLFAALADSSARDKSTTYDEIAHLTGGYSYWAQGDYRLNPENGVLPQLWSAWPVYLGGYAFEGAGHPRWPEADAWSVGDRFFHESGNDLDAMLRTGRRMIVVLAMALGLVIYAWSRRLFGRGGAMVSLLLYVLCPNVLAHSRLVTSDIAVTLTFTVATACLWRMLHRISLTTVLVCGVASGLLFVSKASSVLFVPMWLILVYVRVSCAEPVSVALGRRRLVSGAWAKLGWFAGVTLVCAGVTVLMIWAFHRFQYGSSRADPMRFAWDTVLPPGGWLAGCIATARDWRLLPQPYLYGFAHAVFSAAGREQFLRGELSRTGWWYFFPYALAVKTPLGTLAVLASAVAAVVVGWRGTAVGTRRAWRRRWLYRTAPLLVLLGVYWAVALRSPINIGLRHVLATFGAMFILAGGSVYWLRRRHLLLRAIVPAFVICLAVSSWSIRPHYLAYFNWLVGGPANGYRHLVDSSLDWGQDLIGLRDWLARYGTQGPVYVAYFGQGRPDYYGIEAIDLSVRKSDADHFEYRPRLTGGTYCISATIVSTWRPGDATPQQIQELDAYAQTAGDPPARARLVAQKGGEYWIDLLRRAHLSRVAAVCKYLRLQRREPDAHVGYSILIYHLSDQQVRTALSDAGW